MAISLRPENPGAWAQHEFADLFAVDRQEREALQLEAVKLRFANLRDKVPALRKLADKQGIERIDTLDDVLVIAFDHRVLKNYPLAILEERDFPKLTAWLDKLTAHDLSRVDLSGVQTVDQWIDRLEQYGLIIGTSSGTTGKLSFVARSREELPAWRSAWLLMNYASSGIDPRTTKLPSFSPSYRSGHQMALKTAKLFVYDVHGGPQNHHTLYDAHMSADLLALSGKMQAAEEKGDVARLGLDPVLVEQRRQMIETARHRDRDVQAWFEKLIHEFKGQQVRIGGLSAELFKVAKAGAEKGYKCEFAPGSIVTTGGGMKKYKDAPDNWQEIIAAFFGVEKLSSVYGFSESIGHCPMCSHGYYHFLPYTVAMILDADGQALPREGVQTGRMAIFDLLAESYWGAFISGDEVTMHFDEDCGCGWRGPRIGTAIRRYAEMEGGDDKITCSGSAKAYDEFMDFVMGDG